MKFFTHRQMRSIARKRQERALRMRAREDELAPPERTSVVQLLTGNLDRIAVVASLFSPALRPGLVDRLLVLSEIERLEAVVVLTKVDLVQDRALAEHYRQLYGSLGYPTVLTSIETGEGLEELRARLSSGRSALCGHSGVGKSSLLGALEPALAPATGAVSLANDKGQHTTTAVRLYRLSSGAELFDLPGLKLAPLSMAPLELSRCFPDFAACRCRFRDCLHREEPGCGVRAGVELGVVEGERYASYLRILSSL